MKSDQITLILTWDWCKMLNANVPIICMSCVPYLRSSSLIQWVLFLYTITFALYGKYFMHIRTTSSIDNRHTTLKRIRTTKYKHIYTYIYYTKYRNRMAIVITIKLSSLVLVRHAHLLIIVLAHRGNSPRVGISLHLDSWFWLRGN